MIHPLDTWWLLWHGLEVRIKSRHPTTKKSPVTAMAKPAQQQMNAQLMDRDTDDESQEEDQEVDVEANLCCPDALSAILSTVFCPCWLCSLKLIEQNQRAAVLVWGKYVGSINDPGIHVVNPCGVEIRRVTTVRKTLDVREVSVTDKDGNPIYISGNIAYKMISAKKATVDTDQPDKYTMEMAPMVLRTVASRFHYDELRSGAPTQMLQDELQKLVTSAGVQAQLSRKNHELFGISESKQWRFQQFQTNPNLIKFGDFGDCTFYIF